jgi:hypothetical protein
VLDVLDSSDTNILGDNNNEVITQTSTETSTGVFEAYTVAGEIARQLIENQPDSPPSA